MFETDMVITFLMFRSTLDIITVLEVKVYNIYFENKSFDFLIL